MRTFTHRTGAFLCLLAALAFLPSTALLAEGETAGGGGSDVAGTSSSGSSSNLGIGTFSKFPLSISVNLTGGYDDNVNNSSVNPIDSWFTSAGVLIGYQMSKPRTKLNLSTNLGFTYYSNLSTNAFEPNINLNLTLTHTVTPRFDLGFSALVLYQTEPDFEYGTGTNRRSGNYFVTQDKITGTYLWAPRFSTATSYNFGVVHYDDITAGMFEDRVENTFGNEFRFLVWPTTNLVAEYRFEVVSYEHVNRDSTTNYFLGGFDHVFNPRLSAVFRGGAEFRNYEDVGDRSSPYFEGNLTYKLGKDTSVVYSLNYGIQEGDVTTNSSRQSFRTGLQGTHNITSRVSASLSAFYVHDNYEEGQTPNPIVGLPPIISPAFTEDAFNIDLLLRYSVTRYMGIQAGYSYTDVSSGAMFRDYSRNRVYGGINVTF